MIDERDGKQPRRLRRPAGEVRPAPAKCRKKPTSPWGPLAVIIFAILWGAFMLWMSFVLVPGKKPGLGALVIGLAATGHEALSQPIVAPAKASLLGPSHDVLVGHATIKPHENMAIIDGVHCRLVERQQLFVVGPPPLPLLKDVAIRKEMDWPGFSGVIGLLRMRQQTEINLVLPEYYRRAAVIDEGAINMGGMEIRQTRAYFIGRALLGLLTPTQFWPDEDIASLKGWQSLSGLLGGIGCLQGNSRIGLCCLQQSASGEPQRDREQGDHDSCASRDEVVPVVDPVHHGKDRTDGDRFGDAAAFFGTIGLLLLFAWYAGTRR